MNCDQAFDCLTDSRRRHSADLERHLAACPRCRQMHDTLEPALDLFDGVVEEPDLSGLVRDSRPLVSTESRQLAEQTAARLVTAGGPRPRRGNWTGFVRYSAVFICGALVVLVLGAAQQRFAHEPIPEPESSQCRFWTESPESRSGISAQAAIARCGECHHGPDAVPPHDARRDGGLRGLKFPEIGRLTGGRSGLLSVLQPPRLARRPQPSYDKVLRTLVAFNAPHAELPLGGGDAWAKQFRGLLTVAGPAPLGTACERVPGRWTGWDVLAVSGARRSSPADFALSESSSASPGCA